MMKRILLLLITIVFNNYLYAQFQESSTDLNVDHLYQSTILMGGGIAFIDVNNDNLIDIYLTGGMNTNDHLLLNLGNSKFTDISEESGIRLATEGVDTFGVSIGDLNNDGCDDIFVTTHEDNQNNILLMNDCSGKFTNMSIESGINHKASSTSSILLDLENDGDLDIYVANYIKELDFIRDENDNVIGYNHKCFPNYLYVNDGTGNFSEMAQQYNVADLGCGLAVIASDYNLDGYSDIYIANDFGEWVIPNRMYRNTGNSGFVDVSIESGLDVPMYGMGIAAGDYDNDGDIDFYVTNIGKNVLLHNDGENIFENVADSLNVHNQLSRQGKNTTGWGAFFADVDNNGFQDLFVSNGYIPAAQFLNNSLQDDNKLYLNSGGQFTDVSENFGIDSDLINRGAAYADINNDGAIDILVVSAVKTDLGAGDANTLIYLNEGSASGNWIQIKLQGVSSNTNGFGSRISVFSNGIRQFQECLGGGSHASQNSNILHFGLGTSGLIDSLIVEWPSGVRDIHYNVEANKRLLVIESKKQIETIDCNVNPDIRCYAHETLGCMDDNALNYNYFAVVNNGTCEYEDEEVITSIKPDTKNSTRVYPNPFDNEIRILNNKINFIQIISSKGIVIYSKKIDQSEQIITVNTNDFNNGSYLIRGLSGSKEVFTQIIIKVE